MEKLCGVVENALTRNNWAKLTLVSNDIPSHIKGKPIVVGTCFSNPDQTIGKRIEVEGIWDKHAQWGWQFKATSSQVMELNEADTMETLDDTLNGVIRTVIPRNNWFRISLKPDELPEYVTAEKGLVTVVGECFFNAEIGRRLKIKGKWDKHPLYGWQFKAIGATTMKPTTKEETIDFLSGNLLKGAGRVLGTRIVEYFGEKALEIIEKNPERLTEVKGIGKKKLEQLINSFQDSKKLVPLHTFLAKYGISDGKIKKIYAQYGDQAEAIIKENPYRVSDDIQGFGFKIADSIAKAANIDGNDPSRLRAAVTYVLKHQANLKGHLFLKQAQLAPLVRELLDGSFQKGEISDMDIINAQNAGIDDKKYTRVGSDLYLTPYYKAEQYAAKRLKSIASSKCPSLIDPQNIIRDLEKKFDIIYAPKQVEAITTALSSQLAVITGGPGTGKTTIIRGIIAAYQMLYPNDIIDICAPTGRAAMRITETSGYDAKTVHRLIEMGGGSDDDDAEDTDSVYVGRNEGNPLDSDLIVIDESSMIDMMLMSYFLKAVKKGCKLIFVGDADQLPSVGAGNVFSDMIKAKVIPTVLLNEIFRQADTSRIIINAHKINHGDYPLDWGSDFEFIEEDNEAMVPRIIGKYVADIIRKADGDPEAVQVLTPVRIKTATGVNELNRYLQTLINPETVTNSLFIKHHNITFRIGDKVIQMKNKAKRDMYNGDIGLITKIYKSDETGAMEAIVKFGKKEKVYAGDDFEHLDLSYATTVHKSQGSEFPIIIMPISKSHSYSLQRNILYTAVTRAKEKVILVGSKRHFVIAMKKNEVTNRNSNLLKELDKDL